MKTTCTCSVLPLYCEEQSIKPKSCFGCTNEEARLQRLLVLNHTTVVELITPHCPQSMRTSGQMFLTNCRARTHL